MCSSDLILHLRADDPRFATNAARMANQAVLIELIEERLAQAPAAQWLTDFTAAGIPAGKVRTLEEVYTWEQTRSQGLLVDVDHPTAGRITLPGPPLRFEDATGRSTARSGHTAPPLLNEHGDAVRAWLEKPTE